MKYKHLTIEQREKIQELLWKRFSVRAIAGQLGRSPSSISREINKNIPLEQRRYSPRLANERALAKRKLRGRVERLKNDQVRKYVVAHLKLGWSPEQIAGRCPKEINDTISYEAIYQYIYAQIYQNGHGNLKPGCEDLRPYLARRRKRRQPKGLRKSYRIDKGPLPSIEDRPAIVAQRSRIGDWEDDCIVSRSSTDRLKTINERVSGLVLITKIKDGTMEETNLAVIKRLKVIPQEYRITLTRDRGSENMGYAVLQTTLNLICYFARAYHSWERGSNENLNGLIRRFLPKKTDFRNVTNEEIQYVEYLINSRPRKRLGWKTPYEVFYELTGVALQC